MAIIDDVLSFMNFLKSIKKSVIKPKIWNKESRETETIEPISNSVEKLLFDIGKKVYAQELVKIKKWMDSNQKLTQSDGLSTSSRQSMRHLKNFEKEGSSYSRKHAILVKYFQTI